MKDVNDCSVTALSEALNISYPLAHYVMHRFGRKDGKGASNFDILRAFSNMGALIEAAPRPARITVAKLPTILDPNKTYIAFVHGHVLAIVKGDVRDWTKGRRHIVKELYEVTPMHKPELFARWNVVNLDTYIKNFNARQKPKKGYAITEKVLTAIARHARELGGDPDGVGLRLVNEFMKMTDEERDTYLSVYKNDIRG